MKGLAVVGDVLAGKYRVEKILGIGGMGMVVAATHMELEQRVALKFMLPAALEAPEAGARFLREAKAAGRLNSEHVCRVFDVGRFETGEPYIVMEYLQGQDLNTYLKRRGPMRVTDAVDYILQAIEGLAEAHAHGIVHRDLKPDNLFLAKRNDGGVIVKVLDFGISKASVTGIATKTGDVMGSPAYMAPEQMASTKGVDPRADIWSLGVVLYQIVTGRPPFAGETLPQLCLKVMNDEPAPMSSIRADLPDGFEAIVMRCLQKERDDRYADVGDLAEALSAFGPKNSTTTATRIQIVLRRATNPSTPDISRGFSAVAPTLGNEEFDIQTPTTQYAPVEPGDSLEAVQKKEVTTFQSSAGESLSFRAEQSRSWGWGLVAAIMAGSALVGVIIVMVMQSSSGGDAAPPAPSPTSAKSITPPVPPPAPPGLRVEPIDPSPAPSPAPPPAPPPALLAPPDAGAAVAGDEPKHHKPHKAGGGSAAGRGSAAAPGSNAGSGSDAGSASTAGSASAGSGDGSAAGSDDTDEWTHMTHDHDTKQP